MDALLTDEVWARLDPHAGRLTRRAALRLWLVVLACAVLAAGGLVGWRSGMVVARIETDTFGSWSGGSESLTIDVNVPVVNRGWRTETVVGAGRSGPGLNLQPALAGLFPLTLAPGQGTSIPLRYDVTSCADVPQGDWPVPVRVRRPWGPQTVYVRGPGLSVGAPNMVEYTGRNPYEQPWQRVFAHQACATG